MGWTPTDENGKPIVPVADGGTQAKPSEQQPSVGTWKPDLGPPPEYGPDAAVAAGEYAPPPAAPDKSYQDPYAGRDPHQKDYNALQDVGQMIGGGLATAGLQPARYGENVLAATQGKQARFPIVGLDPQDAPEFGQAMKNNFWDYPIHEYLQPLIKDPYHYGQYLSYRYNQAPLAHLSDAMVLLPGVKAAKTALAARAEKTAATAGMTPRATMQWYDKIIGPALAEQNKLSRGFSEKVINRAQGLDRARLDKLLAASADLKNEWDKFEQTTKLSVTALAEQTDEDLRRAYKGNTYVNRFLDKIDAYNRQMRDILRIPEDEQLLADYGGKYMAAVHRSNPTRALTALDIQRPEHMRVMRRMKAEDLKAGRRAPVYLAMMTNAQVSQALNRGFNSFMGGLRGTATRAAKQANVSGMEHLWGEAVKNAREGLPFKWLRPRESAMIEQKQLWKGGPQVTGQHTVGSVKAESFGFGRKERSYAAKDVVLARLTDAYAFQAIKDLMGFVMDETKNIPKNDPRWVTYDLRERFAIMAKRQGMSDAGINQFFQQAGQDQVRLPGHIAKMFDEIFNDPGKQGGIMQLLEKFGSKPGRYLLWKADPTFELKLAVATNNILAMVPTSPKAAFHLFLSSLMALHPDAERAVPSPMLLSHGPNPLKPEFLRSQENLIQVILRPITNAVEAKSNAGYALHQAQRRALAIHAIGYVLNDSPPTMQKMVGDMFNLSAAIEEIRGKPEDWFNGKKGTGSYDPALVRAMQGFIKTYLGDYGEDTRGKVSNKNMRTFFLAWDWARHNAQMLGIPLKNPLKTAALNTNARYVSRKMQPKEEPDYWKMMGMIPARTAQNKHLRDSSGKDVYIGGWAQDSVEAGLHLLRGALAIALNQEGEAEVPSRLNPIIQSAAEASFMFDFSNKKTFVDEDPRVYQKGSKYYKSGTHNVVPPQEMGKFKHPDILNRTLHNYANKQYDPIRTVATMKNGKLGIPAVQSSPWQPVRKRTRAGELTQDWPEFFMSLAGFRFRTK